MNNYPYMRAFDEMLVEHMKKGHSFDTFHATLRYPKSVVDAWLVEKPGFAQSYALGKSLRKKLLEEMLLCGEMKLDVFKHLIETEQDIDDASVSFDDDVLIQAKERFAK